MTKKNEGKAEKATGTLRGNDRTTRPRARKPTVPYSPEVAERFCEALAVVDSVAAACSQEGMPSESTVYLWLYRHSDFRPKYDAAWDAGCERMANELLAIVDDSSRDRIERKNPNTGKTETVTDHEHIQRSRLRFDARRWLLSKRNRKSFGDHVELGVKGELNHSVTSEPLSDLEIARRHAFLLGLGEVQLREMSFPELAKLMRIEDALRARGINPAEPFDKPAPPPEFLALPAPEIELNPEDPLQSAPAEAASGTLDMQTEEERQQAEADDREWKRQEAIISAECRRQATPGHDFTPGPRRPWRR